MAAKKSGRPTRPTKRERPEPEVGRVVRVATTYDGTVVAEIVERDGAVFVVRTGAGKTYRVLRAEIL